MSKTEWIRFTDCGICGGRGYTVYSPLSSFDGHRYSKENIQCEACSYRQAYHDMHKQYLKLYDELNPPVKPLRADDV